jgi:tripartite-type tricarboxylate transporter receptor subunit TctC
MMLKRQGREDRMMNRLQALLCSMVASVMAAAALFAGFADSAIAQAQYPARPVHLIVGFGAGGPSDLQARILAEPLAGVLGQPVIVENRPGDAGMISYRYVAGQTPDGYTVLAAADIMLLYPILFKSWDVDPLRAFTFVGTYMYSPTVLLTANSAPFKNVGEFISYAKANHGKVNYAFIGPGPHALVVRYMNKYFNMGMTEVPYKSSADAKLATVRGEVLLYPDSLANALADRSVRPLVMISAQREAAFPDVPTANEGELAALRMSVGASWNGIIGPANLPADATTRLNAAINEVVKSPAFVQRTRTMAITAQGSSPEDFRAMVARDAPQWIKLGKELGFEPQ